MASTDSDSSDGGAIEATDTGVDDSMDHGGVIDIERLPGGSRLTAVRADLVTRYEGYLTLDESEKETVRRWGLGSIVSHWLLVLLMLVAVLTGVAIWTGWYGPLEVGIWAGYQVAFQVHVWAGVVLAVIALLVFPFYHRVVDGHDLLVSWTQIKEQFVIALAFLGLVRYIPGYKQARRTYDEDREHWAGYHPAQTAFWYATWFFVGVLTLTGFALWNDLATEPTWWISTLGFMQGWVGYETMLQIHLVATFLTIVVILIHAYVALLPGNRDIFGSMIGGTVKAWRVDEETRPEPADRRTDTGDNEGNRD